MGLRFNFRWQIALVGVLFAASLVVLLWSMLGVFQLPEREREAQKQLIDASKRMAESAASLLGDLPKPPREPPPHLNHRLTEITVSALEVFDAVEGGFFLASYGEDGKGMFAGHAFPNDPQRPAHSPPLPPAKKKGKKHAPSGLALSPDPPPHEKEPIHDQCVSVLTREPGFPPDMQVRVIGPSKVMIVTEPVGSQRPARLATWVMTRLNSPQHTAAELVRFQTSAGLALAGMAVALVLMANLGHNLRRERQQRERLTEELRRAEHFAALGRLLAGVSHEVRNPLAAIRSTVQLFQRLAPPARDPARLDPILHSVDRLNVLVSRLLFFVRSGHEERRPVNLNAIIQETLTLLRAQAESQHVVFQTELASDLPLLIGSAQALQQVALNLTTNALQAMPGGGKLLCRTRRLPDPPRVELWIADSGPGIAAEELPHLFEPFHTTRPEGTGLGLALCREIVQQHGGRIDLDHLEGWGAVFRVTLPMETAAHPPRMQPR